MAGGGVKAFSGMHFQLFCLSILHLFGNEASKPGICWGWDRARGHLRQEFEE